MSAIQQLLCSLRGGHQWETTEDAVRGNHDLLPLRPAPSRARAAQPMLPVADRMLEAAGGGAASAPRVTSRGGSKGA